MYMVKRNSNEYITGVGSTVTTRLIHIVEYLK